MGSMGERYIFLSIRKTSSKQPNAQATGLSSAIKNQLFHIPCNIFSPFFSEKELSGTEACADQLVTAKLRLVVGMGQPLNTGA